MRDAGQACEIGGAMDCIAPFMSKSGRRAARTAATSASALNSVPIWSGAISRSTRG